MQDIIKFVQINFCLKIYFCSLLIFFDNSGSDDAIAKLIDFDLTNNTKELIDNKNGDNINNQNNDSFLGCMNKLIILLKNLMNE